MSKINSKSKSKNGSRSKSHDHKSKKSRKRGGGNISGGDSDAESVLSQGRIPNLKWSRVISLSHQEYPQIPIHNLDQDMQEAQDDPQDDAGGQAD